MRTARAWILILLIAVFFGCASLSKPSSSTGGDNLESKSLLIFHSDKQFTGVTVANINTGEVFTRGASNGKAYFYLLPGKYILAKITNESYSSMRWEGFNTKFKIKEIGNVYLLSLASGRRSQVLDEIRSNFPNVSVSEIELIPGEAINFN